MTILPDVSQHYPWKCPPPKLQCQLYEDTRLFSSLAGQEVDSQLSEHCRVLRVHEEYIRMAWLGSPSAAVPFPPHIRSSNVMGIEEIVKVAISIHIPILFL